MKNTFLFLALFSALIFAQQREVLVEVFTNSHCTVCPPAHAALHNYENNSSNAEHINYIFYHMIYPYPDDPLYQANTEDPAGRNNYYGPFSATPVIFFDGINQGRTYNEFSSRLDSRVSVPAPLNISLSGTKNDDMIMVDAEVTGLSDISQTDMVIHFVVVENVAYGGRNGVAPQYFVMRKMITSSAGEVFTISTGETKSVLKTISLSQEWINDSLSIIVFVESTGTGEVYQSARISYEELETATGVEDDDITINSFKLYQNYPNPFNPVTNFGFRISNSGFVSLKIYDVLGNEVAALVSEEKAAGEYTIKFDASGLSSGIYYYTLRAGNYSESRKMILLK